jgi:hypothetical protein
MSIPRSRALEVGIALWLEAGLASSRTVKLNLSRLTCAGLSRYSAYRGLRKLEEAGLVSVERRLGAVSRVTLLECNTP